MFSCVMGRMRITHYHKITRLPVMREHLMMENDEELSQKHINFVPNDLANKIPNYMEVLRRVCMLLQYSNTNKKCCMLLKNDNLTKFYLFLFILVLVYRL